MKSKTDGSIITTTVSLPKQLLERLDAYADEQSVLLAGTGMRFSRSGVVRLLLTRALEGGPKAA
jgi:hypothetical protein